MKQWITIFLVGILPNMAMSETAVIRAGEHPTFTRLVIDILPSANWNIIRNDGGYEITFSDVTDFDTSTVFNRIPTSRIFSITSLASGDGLQIGTNCDCHATAFKWRPDKLVVDINDGSGKVDSPFEARAELPTNRQTLPIVGPTPTRDFRIPARPDVPDEVDQNSIEQDALSALEAIVVESLARGASQGLLTPSKDLSLSEGAASATQTPVVFEGGGAQPGLLAHTSIDLGKIGAGDVLPIDDAVCQSEKAFDISEWGGNAGLFEVIAPLRESLTGELGEAEHEAINKLAKAYLYFGFGREAKGILALDEENSQERLTLQAIASIIDEDTMESDVFGKQIDCNGPSAFWAFVSREAGSTKKGNRDAILSAFRNLPVVLQSHLAPRLSRRFLEVGDTEAAEMAFSIENFVENTTIESKLAKAELQAETKGDIAKAASLANMAESDARITPEAVLDLFKLSQESGIPVDTETMTLAEILRFENAGSPLASQLAVAQIEANLDRRSETAAFDLLLEVGGLIAPDTKRRLEAKAVIVATTDRETGGFLDLAFSELAEKTEASAQNAMAKRLLELGLAERAAILVEGDAAGAAMMERRYLRAEAALELGDPLGVLEDISGLKTERADSLRARASLLGDQPNVLEEVSVGDDWRQGNWASLSTSDDPLLQSVSNAILANAMTNNTPDEPLAFGKELIAQSEETRALLDEILSRYTPVSQ